MVAGGALGAPLDLSVDGAVDTLPPMPNGIAVIQPLEEGALRSANKGLLVVKDPAPIGDVIGSNVES